MLNKIWPILIMISIFYGIFTGNIVTLNETIFNSSKDAVELTIILLGTICLWNGIIEIASNTRIVDRLIRILTPIINFLFPDSKEDRKTKQAVSMNIIANMLGLGNAATPLGLKVMNRMQEKNTNKSELTDDMIMFIVLNTLSIQIIPTTIIAIRMSLGSINPTKIIFAVWVSSICASFVGIFLTKLCLKIERKR